MKLRTWILGFRPFFDLLLIEKKRSDCDSYEWFFLPFLRECVEKLSVQASD